MVIANRAAPRVLFYTISNL